MGLKEAIALVYLIFLLLEVVVAAASTNTTTANITQIAQKVPPPPPGFVQTLLNYIAKAYDYLVSLIQNALQKILTQENPQVLQEFSSIIAWLVSLTAIYIIVTVIEVIRKFIGYIILVGWIFVLLLIFMSR